MVLNDPVDKIAYSGPLDTEIEAQQKLEELCRENNWPLESFLVEEKGPGVPYRTFVFNRPHIIIYHGPNDNTTHPL